MSLIMRGLQLWYYDGTRMITDVAKLQETLSLVRTNKYNHFIIRRA